MTRQRADDIYEEYCGYPYALVLRLRVAQVVCGISTLLMGAVALIEEQHIYNLGLAIPAGLSTVIAAGIRLLNYRVVYGLGQTLIVFFINNKLLVRYTESLIG